MSKWRPFLLKTTSIEWVKFLTKTSVWFPLSKNFSLLKEYVYWDVLFQGNLFINRPTISWICIWNNSVKTNDACPLVPLFEHNLHVLKLKKKDIVLLESIFVSLIPLLISISLKKYISVQKTRAQLHKKVSSGRYSTGQ